jgi:hypothetical protein
MFAKNKVSQSMIDAVNDVTKLDEASPIKEPTPTGMRVYGRNYGNSAKAKQDQTKSDLDKIKGPKDKEMKEAAKPDFLDMDKDGNKKEPMKKAIADKGMKEELKGDQHKIDANHNNKIDGQDFAILKGKKKVKESFNVRLAEKWKEIKEKKDIVMPEETPVKNQDVADKSYLKDKPGSIKSDLKNLGRFLTGKKETNEEVELTDEATIAGTSGWEPMKKNVKDKSGAVHTPMSRAKDLARSAFKKVQDRTKLDK